MERSLFISTMCPAHNVVLFSMWLGSNQVRVCMNTHAQTHTHAHTHMPDLYNSAGFPWERSLVGTCGPSIADLPASGSSEQRCRAVGWVVTMAR